MVIFSMVNLNGRKSTYFSFVVTSPKVSISPVLLSVREGDSAQFRCSAIGFPAPVLQWHSGPDSKLPSEAILSNDNGLLTIPKVEKINEGKYFCTAENLGGISGTSAFLNVSGKKLILHCSSFFFDFVDSFPGVTNNK